jgi:hypothetical protein
MKHFVSFLMASYFKYSNEKSVDDKIHIFFNLPPKTSQRKVKEAPSEKGPTTDVSSAPDSFVMTIFCGGTETR